MSAADSDAHGVMCAGCLQTGLLQLASKYERLANIKSARFCRAEDVLADLRSLLPATRALFSDTTTGGEGDG